jgi:hypothetical protein
MRLIGVVIGGLVLSAVVALSASAAGGFGELSVVGAGQVATARFLAQPVAALGAGGDGALAWSDGARVHVARRAPGGGWTAQMISPRADEVPDLKLVITRDGDTVAAWTEDYAEKRGTPNRFMAAVGRRGRRFGRPQVIAAGGRAASALPQMAALADGRVILIWRAPRLPFGGELRLAFLEPDHRFGRSRGLGRDGVAPAVVATTDGGAVVAWEIPGQLHAPHPLRAARLPAHGHRLGRSFQFFRSAAEGARLASGPGNVVVASWASRRPAAIAAHVSLLAAQLTPRRGRVHTLSRGEARQKAAAIAVGPHGSALAAFPARFRGAARRQWAVSGTAAGEFAARVPLTPVAPPEVSLPSPSILPSGEALVVWSQGRPVPGKPTFEVLLARRPAGSSAFADVETLGSGHYKTGSLPPVMLAQAAGRVLVAWPAPGPSGGLIVTERR